MKYAVLEQRDKYTQYMNIGDYVQGLAAIQYLPEGYSKVDRDKLNEPLNEPTKVIMNGWFTYHPENWPPNDNIIPLFVSFHLNPYHAERVMSKKENIDYLKKHSPIGCRDYSTLAIMEKHGIDAYFSSCLTTTLDIKYKSELPKTDEIIFADVMYKLEKTKINLSKLSFLKKVKYIIGQEVKHRKRTRLLKKLFPDYIVNQSINVKHDVPKVNTFDEYYDIAETVLKRYSRAKLVVTSRIHCALPCLAVGTPVLFILEGLKNPISELPRLKGTVEHMNILTTQNKEAVQKLFDNKVNIYHPSEIDWDNPPVNPNTHLEYSEELKKKCYNFINQR